MSDFRNDKDARETYAGTSSQRQTALSSLHNAGLSAVREYQLEIRNCTARLPVYRARHFREIAFPVLPRLACACEETPELVDRRKRTNAPRETGRREAVVWKENSDEKRTKMKAIAIRSPSMSKTALNLFLLLFCYNIKAIFLKINVANQAATEKWKN